MSIILMDVDGTLAAFTEGFYDLAEQIGGKPIPERVTTLQRPSWKEWPGLSRELESQTWASLKRSEYFWADLGNLTDAHSDDATAIILSHYRDALYFCTSRPGTFVLTQTCRWLGKLFDLLNPHVIVVKRPEFKADVAKAIGADYSLEDRLDVALSLASYTKSFLITRPYNMGPAFGVTRVETVREFFEHVK